MRNLPIEDLRESEESLSDRQRLRSLLHSPLWKEVVAPILEEKVRTIEENIAVGKSTSLEDLRYAQGQHSIWRQLLREPLFALTRLKREG